MSSGRLPRIARSDPHAVVRLGLVRRLQFVPCLLHRSQTTHDSACYARNLGLDLLMQAHPVTLYSPLNEPQRRRHWRGLGVTQTMPRRALSAVPARFVYTAASFARGFGQRFRGTARDHRNTQRASTAGNGRRLDRHTTQTRPQPMPSTLMGTMTMESRRQQEQLGTV